MPVSRIVGIILAVSMAYAVLRYNVAGDAALNQIPAFILNKAVSYTALVLFGIALLQRDTFRRRSLGFWAAGTAGVHILLSFVLLNPGYFGQFYTESGTFTWSAELAWLTGAVATMLIVGLMLHTPSGHQKTTSSLRPGWGQGVLMLTAVHVAAMGYAGWFAPSTWPGWLPPITLLSFVTALGFLVARRRMKRGSR